MNKCDPLGVTFFGAALLRVGDWQEAGWLGWLRWRGGLVGVGVVVVRVVEWVVGVVKLVEGPIHCGGLTSRNFAQKSAT